jgi:hypothetical protein
VGVGTYNSPANTITRTSVLNSSNGGSPTSFTAGTKDVFMTYPALTAVYADGNGDTSLIGNLTLPGVSGDTLFGGINIGFPAPAVPTAQLHINASGYNGTAGTAPIKLTDGELLVTPEAGTIEYGAEDHPCTDDTNLYFTNNTISGRGYVPSIQIYRILSTSTVSNGNFFGSNSAINLAANSIYEIEAYCFFTKSGTTAVTVSMPMSVAPDRLSGTLQYGAAAGGTATGAANQISIFESTSTTPSFGASATLSQAVKHAFNIKLIVWSSSSSISNLRFNFNTVGSIITILGSYYTVTKLPNDNLGSFAA